MTVSINEFLLDIDDLKLDLKVLHFIILLELQYSQDSYKLLIWINFIYYVIIDKKMNDIKKNKSKRYKNIVKQSKFWPIVQLFKDRNRFMNEVSQKSQKKILTKNKTKGSL